MLRKGRHVFDLERMLERCLVYHVSPAITKTSTSTLVLCRNMLTDRPLSVSSLGIVLKQEKLSYDGTVVSEYDALLYVKMHL